MEILISEPFEIRLDLLDIENRYPSANFDLVVKEERYSDALCVTKNIWIAKSNWDQFVCSLGSFGNKNAEEHAILQDMDGEVYIKISKTETYLTISFSYELKKPELERRAEIISRMEGYQVTDIQKVFAGFVFW